MAAPTGGVVYGRQPNGMFKVPRGIPLNKAKVIEFLRALLMQGEPITTEMFGGVDRICCFAGVASPYEIKYAHEVEHLYRAIKRHTKSPLVTISALAELIVGAQMQLKNSDLRLGDEILPKTAEGCDKVPSAHGQPHRASATRPGALSFAPPQR